MYVDERDHPHQIGPTKTWMFEHETAVAYDVLEKGIVDVILELEGVYLLYV